MVIPSSAECLDAITYNLLGVRIQKGKLGAITGSKTDRNRDNLVSFRLAFW